MAGPNWSDDDPADGPRIIANLALALTDAEQMATVREVPTEDALKRWHATIYAGCNVPSAVYVGRLRGEADPDLSDYEVGVGPVLPDGWPECVGVCASDVVHQTAVFLDQLRTALTLLDAQLVPGDRPTRADELEEVVSVVAIAHGELVRIHPFVNGNGRTARLLAAHISLRYGLPVFVMLKPRPDDVAYARASKHSMGRPPAFVGDHQEAIRVFTHLLALALLGP